jgi:hypothetical protein
VGALFVLIPFPSAHNSNVGSDRWAGAGRASGNNATRVGRSGRVTMGYLETRRKAAETPRRDERPVNTFVVRRWPPDCAGERYEIAHVQSGQRTVVADFSSASAWIGEFSRTSVSLNVRPDVELAGSTATLAQ